MSDQLEAYLEEIGHFLSGREERDEILGEIRSHILEKAEREQGGATEDGLAKVIAAYGPPRRVAARYMDENPIIAPIYRRFLFRYTALLFTLHALLTLAAVIFREDFIMFPFLFIPRLGAFDAVFYLPTAFLFDLGAVTLVLYFITRSGKEVELPWPKFALDIDEVRPPKPKALAAAGAGVMLALTVFAAWVFGRFGTVFVLGLGPDAPRPLLVPEVGRRLSLIVLAMLAAGAIGAAARLLTASRWIDVASGIVSLVLIGLLLRQPFDAPFAVGSLNRLVPWLRMTLVFTLLIVAFFVAVDLVKALVALGRRRLAR